MDEPQTDGSSQNRLRGSGKRGATSHIVEEAANTGAVARDPPNAPPCGACKFLRRKCVINGCIFAPYFTSDQGTARFAAVHKVFGASNVSKLLSHIPANRRHDAVATISYEAQARLTDPVHGCVSTIIALQQQVASLQEEVSMVQTQVINSKFAMIQNSSSSASNNLISINNNTNSNNFSTSTTSLSNSFDEPSYNVHHLSQQHVPDYHDQEEQILHHHPHPVVFANHIFH